MRRFWDYITFATITLTSLVFYRGVKESFDLTKTTILWILCLPIFASLIVDFFTTDGRAFARRHWHWFLLLSAFASSALVARNGSYALFGQTFRYTGFLTIASAWALGYLISTGKVENPLRVVVSSLSVSSIGCALYVYLQASDSDPFAWGTASFGVPVFGTVGNPNTASGFLAVCCPIILAGICSPTITRSVRVLGGIGYGMAAAAIPSLVSFQGQVVVLITGVLLLCYSVLTNGFDLRLRLSLVAMAAVALCSGTNLLPAIAIPLAGLFCGALAFFIVFEHSPSNGTSLRKIRWIPLSIISLVVTVAVAAVPAVRQSISKALAEGFVERGDFYRAAVSVFMENPLFGGGLEQFGFQFPSHRPRSNAEVLEASRTTSVHSVPLALLSAGGLLLGLAFVIFLLMVLRRWIRNRKTRPGESSFWLVSAFGLSLVQISVAVEHVSMYVQLFVLAGLASSGAGVGKSKTARRSRDLQQKATFGVFLSAVVLLVIPLTTTFRASYSSLRATRAFNSSGDLESAVSSFEKIVRMSPWEFGYRSDLGSLYQQAGRYPESAEQLMKAVEITNYLGPVSLPAVEVLAFQGRLPEAVDLIVKIQENDPFAPALRLQCISFLEQIATAYLDDGQADKATEIFATADAMKEQIS